MHYPVPCRNFRQNALKSKSVSVLSVTLAALLMIFTGSQVFAQSQESGPGKTRASMSKKSSATAASVAPAKKPSRADALSDEGFGKPDRYRAEATAFPNETVEPPQSEGARSAWKQLDRDRHDEERDWRLISPSTNTVDALATYTGRATTVAGRVTALALTPGCGKKGGDECVLLMGAAGGGVWRAEEPFEGKPDWKSINKGIDSTAIGAIAVDPNGRGKVIYVGTGEPNLSGDSEAGVGLYKTNDGGDTWQLMPASVPLARGLSIGGVAVDPSNPRHIIFGTSSSVHGSAASASASYPPNTPPLGLYESINGGDTFSSVFISPQYNAVYGGVTQVEFDPRDPGIVYFTALGIGIYRRAPALDGAGVKLVFRTGGPNDGYNRLAFALADRGTSTRIYAADTVDYLGTSAIYRVDNAGVPAATLSNVSGNIGWISLSSPNNGDPGFASYGFCQGQCFYDLFIGTPPGRPDEVWIGGSMNYDEIFGYEPPRSNGRAVMRSTDAGVHFADMTRDTRNPSEGMHPDQHAIVFNPQKPGMAIIGSDGGVVRTDGKFVNTSGSCASRPGVSGPDLVDCLQWLSAVPNKIDSLNAGLSTLQFQSVSLNPKNPRGEFMGGTQDNGTWAYGTPGRPWFESIGGDGGQSGFDAVNPNIRVHTYYSVGMDVNFRGAEPLGWNYISDPLYASLERSAFYVPLITDPVVGGTMFVGMQHIFRTKDNGGTQASLEAHCNEYTYDGTIFCGDWVPIGGDLTSTAYGSDNRAGRYVVAIGRSSLDTGSMWAGTFRGRLFVTRNADADNPAAVAFQRVDSLLTPRRGVSDVVVDSADGNHAWASFTGYGAYTPSAPGHVYDIKAPVGGAVVITDISYNIGDMPVTGLARDDATGDLYAATDFGVLRLALGTTTWRVVGRALPPVAVYHLTFSQSERVLYAATHGRSVWRLDLRD